MADVERSVALMEPENSSEMAVNYPPDETENEFEVEKIIAMVKTKGKKVLYRVRWLGYGPDHDTWEPYENLESCRDMIDQFIEDERKKKKAKHKKKSEVQNSATSGTSSTQHSEKKAPTWKYVTQDEEEYDTLKDKFWRDLEQGKVDVFKAGDMYSKVKASGRASRPKSFADMFKSKLPVVDDMPQSQPSGRGRGRGRGSSRGRRKRQKSSDATDGEQPTPVGSGSKRVRSANKLKRGRGRGIRGRGSPVASGGAERDLSVYNQLQDSLASKEHSDSISLTSCDTLSSTDTRNMPLSDDSSQTYQIGIHEDIIGVVPVSSPDDRAYFEQVSLDKVQRTEGGYSVKVFSVNTKHSSVMSQSTDITNSTMLGDVVSACKLDNSTRTLPATTATGTANTGTTTATTPSIHCKLRACHVVLTPLPNNLIKSLIQRDPEPIACDRDGACDHHSTAFTHLKPISDHRENTGGEMSGNEQRSLTEYHLGNGDYFTGMQLCNRPTHWRALTTLTNVLHRRPFAQFVPCTVSAERADGLTDPSSVASSTATSASSANESGIVADSCPERLHSEASSHLSDELTPKDCSMLNDSLEMADLDAQVSSRCEPEVGEHMESGNRCVTGSAVRTEVGRNEAELVFNSSHINTGRQQVVVASSSSEDSASHGTASKPAGTAPEHAMEHSNHCNTNASNIESIGHQSSASQSSSALSSPSSSVSRSVCDSRNHVHVNLTATTGTEQMPLTQIQPTITSLVTDKSLLNNNKGETGDEEFEFDLDEFDPSEWDGKLVPQMPLPDVLELSNAELRLAVQENDYECLARALQANRVYDLEQPDNMGTTLVMIAAEHGFDDVLELLVLKGANVNSEQKNGTTPLMLACEQGLRCTVALLLLLGAHMNKYNCHGETALIKAVKCGHKSIVKQLLDHGANFASPCNMDSPLKYARHQKEIFDLFNTHISRVTAEFEHQVQITLNNTAQIICALFPMQCFALRESEKIKVIFKHELQPTRPGVGMLLFIAHARITSQEVRCRFYGPCAVLCTVLNGVKLDPLTEGGNFVMSFCPLHNGKNELELLTAKAPTSEAKLIVCAYKAQLI